MKYFLFLFIAYVLVSSSCTKQPLAQAGNGFIKSIPADSNISAMEIILMNQTFIVVSRSMDFLNPPYAVKMDLKGNVIWQKRLSSLNNILWDVFDTPGNGFVTIGYNQLDDNHIIICQYDDDGNYLSASKINMSAGVTSLSPFKMMQLKNGNYLIAGSDNLWNLRGYLLFLNTSFQLTNMRTISEPVNYYGCYINAMQQLEDSSFVFAASGSSTNGTNLYNTYSNTYLIHTNKAGLYPTLNILHDTLNSQTPNLIIPTGKTSLLVSSTMRGWGVGEGMFVNYNNSNIAGLVSGKIQLQKFDSAQHIISNTVVTSYPGNGMINSVNKTSDGGFILCGTVNEANTTAAVSQTRIYLLKLDATGNQLWSKMIETTNPAYGIDAVQTNDDGYLICGHEYSLNKKYNTLIIKTDEKGNVY